MTAQDRLLRLADFFGLRLPQVTGPQERMQHVRTTTAIGITVGLLFGAFNLSQGFFALGMTELAAVVFLLVPAAWLGRGPKHLDLAEALVLAAALLILGALIVWGGVEGTGIFWASTAPFLAFFLKGQRTGWWCSLGFMAWVTAYFWWINPRLDFSYKYTAPLENQFLLSLGFYTLVAAAFNQLRARFEEQLQQRVDDNTAAARALLAQLQHLATHDALTGLPNRVGLVDALQQDIRQAQAGNQGLLLCHMRMERLFEMGNVLGSAGADNLVRRVAQHLAETSPEGTTLARTGRDEFVVFQRMPLPMGAAHAPPGLITDRQFSLEEQGYSLYIEFTMGLAACPTHADTAELLLNKAEQAMLQARKTGLPWSVYDQGQEHFFVRHHLLFGKLRAALASGQLEMHYQPQFSLANGQLVGAEALARWNDPTYGQVAPSVFVPVAEESGLIRPLTAWLVGECMRECARWHREGLPLAVSINLSALNLLDPSLLEVLEAARAATGLDPGSVNLEITESCFMASPERALEVIARIHEAGFKLSIDDFGTGYSSLAYLKNLPIDELKIDQSFVRNLLHSTGDQAIVSSTIDLAHNFSLAVVAEGIEDQATAAWLAARGCDIGQGYCHAKPMRADHFRTFARGRHENHPPQ